MEAGIVRGGTIEEVKSKKFNIYAGISLGNKWFTKENIKSYILWGLKHTKNRFGIVIADTLQIVNYKVLEHMSEQASTRKALREGDKFIALINEILKELPEDKKNLVDIIRWEDLKKDQFYKIAYPIFLYKFKEDDLFRKEIKLRDKYY